MRTEETHTKSDATGGRRCHRPARKGSPRPRSCLAFFVLLCVLSAKAQGTNTQNSAQTTPNPQHQTLSNGLELLLLPIPDADRVTVTLLFRGGAEAQTAKTAGYFRLFERVLLRGTAGKPGEPEPAEALEALGTNSLGAGTERDRLSLELTTSPENLGPGLDTLAYVFSDLRREAALADASTLQQAKAAAADELAAQGSDPQTVYEAAVARRLFSSAPWRLDPLGSPKQVQAASAQDLELLASTWLVPNNAAIVVTGDFSPEDAAEAAQTAFGGWPRGADPWKTPPTVFPKPGVTRPTLVVYADPSVPKGEALIELRYRGPDSLSARSAQAELWAELAGRKGSRLEKALAAGMPSWSSPSELSTVYHSSRYASWLSLSTRIRLSQKGNPADAAMNFKEIARGSEMYALKTNPSYFGAKDLEQGKAALLGERREKLADPEKAARELCDEWVRGGWSWMDSWDDRVSAVSAKDLSAFADEYFMKNLEVVGLRLSPEEYAARKKSILGYGFTEVGTANAFWWK